MIPAMTDPMGKYWDQPARVEILIDDTHAAMTPATFGKLAEYSSSLPSGVYNGKMWKRQRGSVWLLYWYGPSDRPDMCSINERKIIVITDGIDAKEAPDVSR